MSPQVQEVNSHRYDGGIVTEGRDKRSFEQCPFLVCMNLERFLQALPDSFYAWGTLCAYPRDPRRYIEVSDTVQGMSTPSTMHVLNLAVGCLGEGEAYLEVGTWRGLTLIGAMLGNAGKAAYTIDNSVMTEHNKDDEPSQVVWARNVAKYSVAATYIEGEVPAVFASLSLPPVGVYFFDGDKATTEAAYEGLAGAAPLLSEMACIIVDDANTPQIREAIYWFCQHHPKAVKLLDLPTPANCWPSFWNGLIVLGWGVSVVRGE